MPSVDRLSALISRFTLSVTPCAPEAASLLLLAGAGDVEPTCLMLAAEGHATWHPPFETVIFSAGVAWGGADNPLLAALPPEIRHDLRADPEMRGLAGLLQAETAAQRCGSASVLDRLGEVLMVRLLRRQMEEGAVQPGLLGGLADQRLSRAIVAMHEEPGKPWRNDMLADLAGLSISRFAELFRAAVGETPSAYLRKWRLTLAKQDVVRGDRIQSVARRYGYASPEALTRAFHQAYGKSPTGLRKAS
ncbi:MAG: AraC family transcriptional regulator [Pseudomonadota bacterium]